MPDTPTENIGANIRAEMARRDIKQASLAAALGISQPQISARLRGTVPFDVNELQAAADYLGVPVETLMATGVAA